MSMMIQSGRFGVAATPHRYWRILFTNNQGRADDTATSGIIITEMEMRGSIGGADLTGSGTAAADTVNGGDVAANAFDNNGGTKWSSTASAFNHWLSYDFGSPVSVVEVSMENSYLGLSELVSPRDFSLQWSDDNSAWTTSFIIHGEDNWTTAETRVYSDPGTAVALQDYAGVTDAGDILTTNLRAWFPNDLITGSNGDAQSRLIDRSGNNLFGRQAASAKRPTLVTANLNSLNVLRYTGSSSQAFALPDILFSGATAASAYRVIKLNADPPASTALTGFWRIGNSTGSSSTCHFPYDGDSNVYDDFASNARKTVGNPTPSLASWRIVSFHSASGAYSVYIDGVQVFTTATNTVGFSSWPSLGRSMKQSDGSLYYFDAWEAETVFSIANDGTTPRQKMEGYLAWKWGLTGNLAGGHPYKSSPP